MKNKKLVIMLTLIILLSITAIAIGITINAITERDKQNTVSSEPHVKTAEEKANEELEELKTMTERERVQFYISKYISYLEAGDYESAYNLLYSEFKDNYFKSIDEFKSYIKQKYPNIITLNYTNIERLGTYYISTVEFKDLINNEKNFVQLFVVKENNYNDFVLSFQAE